MFLSVPLAILPAANHNDFEASSTGYGLQHSPPSTLNSPAQGLGCPSPRGSSLWNRPFWPRGPFGPSTSRPRPPLLVRGSALTALSSHGLAQSGLSQVAASGSAFPFIYHTPHLRAVMSSFLFLFHLSGVETQDFDN